MIPLLLFDWEDDKVLAAIPLVANGRELDEIDMVEIVVLAAVPMAKVERVFTIVRGAKFFRNGKLSEVALLYLSKRVKSKLESGGSKKRRR